MQRGRIVLLIWIFIVMGSVLNAQQIMVAGKPGQLDIRAAGAHSIRITLKPIGFKKDFPVTPALASRAYPAPALHLLTINQPVKASIGNLQVTVSNRPLTIKVTNQANEVIQKISFDAGGKMLFNLDAAPILGMGEGGPKPLPGSDWRNLPVQFDRRGGYDSMQPRWQGDAYGSRNPVPLLIGLKGWGIFIATPWVQVDLSKDSIGTFIPWKPSGIEAPQTVQNQDLNQGKGLPPVSEKVEDLFDFFILDAHQPAWLMKDISLICGPAVLPPKWALGYMQSHRLLRDETQMIGIVDTFRAKKIPVDAVIYLGTGFTPRGWNTRQPSFQFNPEVFKREPVAFFSDMHKRNVKVVLHMVPWDRDSLPTLQGNIPPVPGEIIDNSHIQHYWQQHLPLIKAGVDAFWPDEGDWFNLFERIRRHQLYYQGPLSTNPAVRPWSLHRNGFLGIAQWGGWVWSGDTESSWKTLEAQIAVGINHSLSLSPFWGSDIGGFYANKTLTGELYARWFQFGAFNASFRSHGRTWWTRLPWGWGRDDMGPKEDRETPLQSEMNNPAIEPVVKKYDELRYQLLPYNYTLAWEARQEGMPLMRAMWLHYPTDTIAAKKSDQFLWGRDLLIAPVYEKGATSRALYLPKGDWYDWWTNEKQNGGRLIEHTVDLATMPIYVRAGAIIPVDPVRQYTAEKIDEPTTLKIFSGADGQFTLYDDDGISQDYLKEKGILTVMSWNDKKRELRLKNGSVKIVNPTLLQRTFRILLLPENKTINVQYKGQPLKIKL